jgi:RecA-family ATPase
MKPSDANDILRKSGSDGLREAFDRAKRTRPKTKTNGETDAPNGNPLDQLRLELSSFDTTPIPEREWGVRGRFPKRNVALLSGHGGAGKSILLLQLKVAHVLGADWLRSMPERGPAMAVNCEDEGDELARRLQPILKHHGASFSDVARDLHIFPLVKLPNHAPLLAHVQNGIIRPTKLYTELLAKVIEVKPICIAIDNVADIFGGDEINRVQVRQFVGLMRHLAITANGYVILSAHPSLQGITSKTGLSGSTQWHNSVRARAYLRAPDDKNGGQSSDLRVLEFLKSNYSALSEQVELKWTNGLYLPAPILSAPEQATARDAAATLFLQLLDRHTREGINVSPKPASNNYAPRLFADTAEAKAAATSKDALADAMSRLVAVDKICTEPYGPPSRRSSRLVHRSLL